jgi:iron complex transport system substrate-binding protein
LVLRDDEVREEQKMTKRSRKIKAEAKHTSISLMPSAPRIAHHAPLIPGIQTKTMTGMVLILLAAVLLSGCGAAGQTANTVEVTDMLGRTVLIPEDPQRLAVLDPFSSQAVIMLGDGDRMVATVGGVKRDLLLQNISPSLINAEIVKEEGAINAEALLRLKADLIIIRGDDYAKRTERDKIERLGIPYLVVEYRTMEGHREAVRLLGESLGCQEEASEYIHYYEESIKKVSSLTDAIADVEKISVYHSISTAIRTDSAESIGAEWTEVSGAKNVALNAELVSGEREYNTTIEEIYLWDPDVIICNESGVNEYILMAGQWQGLRAVREGRVYQIPIGISRMGHFNSIETPLAMLWLSELLYPELFIDRGFREELADFYLRFFDYGIDDAMIDSILSGKGIRAPGIGGAADR